MNNDNMLEHVIKVNKTVAFVSWLGLVASVIATILTFRELPILRILVLFF